MSTYITRLQMQAATFKDDGQWELLSDFVYDSSVAAMRIAVPKGFQTDLASVPRLPIVYWLTGGRAGEAAVLHDWLYTTKPCSRRIADHVLLEASDISRVPTWASTLMFWGVRVFGWSHWK